MGISHPIRMEVFWRERFNFMKWLEVINSNKKAKATRLAFGEALRDVGELNPNVVALDADLSKSTRTDLFAEKFPDRFFEMGISEANMIGVAAGLANVGKVPFAASFGCFLTGRYDQIRMSVSASKANVKLVGTHAGVAIGEDGHSQMALEDLALMRVLPGMTVFQPGDEDDAKDFVKWTANDNGASYMRLTRQNLPSLNRSHNYQFAPGKWLRLGVEALPENAIVLLGTGGTVEGVIGAADMLAAKGVGPLFVVNANWIKPFDEKFLEECIQKKAKWIVTVEDHYTAGGLGGLVAEYVSGLSGSTRLLRLGVDTFGQSGTPKENYIQYGLDAKGIYEKVLRVCG